MTEETLFAEVLSRAPAERAAFLAQACAGQPELRAAVEALLAAHEKSGNLLDRPPAELGQTVESDAGREEPAFTGEYTPQPDAALLRAAADGPAAAVGAVIAGRYTLVEKIGEGGMGEVWVAKQTEPVKRRVALKVIKAGMDTRAVLARFEQERQALALMDHPNIARVLDGGMTAEGRPFFVMELVNGLPLTRFCDEARLTPRQRLEVFVPICQAVQHAHQKGIVHRDLKPANILVNLIDGRPVPRVIDFGVAKAISGKLTDESLSTQFGAVVGTLEYMAPEQAGFSGEDIDTRADIYSLGVILFELLTGLRPLDSQRLKKAAFSEMIRIIQEEEPPRPSTRLSTDESLPSLAALRQTEPRRLMALLRGELDWVVMKCLEKQRDRRYETANALGRDIQRYLVDEPVEARPPSVGYRLSKFLRRNKGPVLAVGIVFAALLVGIIGTTFGLFWAEQRRQEAEQAWAEEGIQRRLAETNEAKALMAAAAEKKAKEQESVQRTKAEKARDRTRQALDAMTSSITGDALTTQKEFSQEQKKFLSEVLTYYQEFAGERAEDESSRARTARAARRVGSIEYWLGRKKEGETASRLALDGYERLAAAFPAAPEYRREIALSHYNLGVMLQDLGKRPEAEEQYRQARTTFAKLAAELPAAPEYRQMLALSATNLGSILKEQGKRPEAEEQYRSALTIFAKLAGAFPDRPDFRRELAGSYNNLGALLKDLRKFPETEEHYRKGLAIFAKLAKEFPAAREYRRDLGLSRNNLGALLDELGKKHEAEQQYRKALELRQTLAADYPGMPDYRQGLAGSHNNLGVLLNGLGKRAEAEEQHRKAVAILEKLADEFPAVPKYRQQLALSQTNLGDLLNHLGNPAEAEEQLRKALAVREKLTREYPDSPEYRHSSSLSHYNLGVLLDARREKREAEEQYRQAMMIQEKLAAEFPAVTAYRHDLGRSLNNLGNLLWAQGKQHEALQQHRQAVAIREKLAAAIPAEPVYRRNLAGSYNNLGVLLQGLGKRPEAEEQGRKALTIQESLATDFPAVLEYQIELGGSYCNKANLVRDSGQPGSSMEWYEKAIGTLTAVYEQRRQVVVAKQFLRNSHVGRAIAYTRLQKFTEAVNDWDKAVDLSPRREQPGYRAARASARIHAGQVAEAVAEVAELAKTPNWNAGQWYDFACVYALASGKSGDKKQVYADRAMDLLTRAVRAGYMDAAHLKKDTGLDSIRARDDFKKLLAELKKKAPA